MASLMAGFSIADCISACTAGSAEFARMILFAVSMFM
jgi:hypothetical protein